MITRRLIPALAVLVCVFSSPTHGVVKLPSIFGDHMVLQASTAGPQVLPSFFGFADPGEKVTIKVGAENYTATAGSDGRWKVNVKGQESGTGPLVVQISGSSGSMITYNDVWFGEVILCSGQSNMGVPVSYIYNATATIAAANHPNIRLFKVALSNSTKPLQNVTGMWQLCTPQTVPSFSAVCYLTGLWLMRMVWGKSPIGLIASDWGGTPIEAWMSPSALDKCKHNHRHESLEWTAGRQIHQERNHDHHAVGGPGTPSVLYNAMIHPIAGYGIQGALWYQGESNVLEGRAVYKCLLTSMVQSWRAEWQQGNFPFLVVQLAPYKSALNVAELRLSQTDVLARNGGELESAGTAIIIDLGDPTGTIHPHNKTEVGRRMALQFINVALQGNQSQWHYSGPLFESATFSSADSLLTVKFTFADGLFWNDTHGCHEMSQCCDTNSTVEVSADPPGTENASWATVQAEIGEGQITVKEFPTSVKSPKAVRMEYASFPGCALFNEYQLPVEPFVKPVTAA